MGFTEGDALKLKPENADRGWVGILRNWKGVLDPRLTAPVGVRDWETHSTALTFAEATMREVAAGDRWNLLEACGLVPYKSGKPLKPDPGKAPPIRNYKRPGQ